MDIPYIIISQDNIELKKQIDEIVETAKNENRPVAIIIKKGTFDKIINSKIRNNDSNDKH